MQAGILQAEERDYRTAFDPLLHSLTPNSLSYFIEAFEGMSSVKDRGAVLALKYMVLCKVMTDSVRCDACCADVVKGR